MTARAGELTVVGTPIGNLADLSPRATEALAAADVIACEDTRRTGRLLQLVGLERRDLVVVNDHTEDGAAAGLVRRAEAGDAVVLVSDAGMPAVSDPGEHLVAAFVAAGLAVTVVPGPSAAITAVSGSGLPSGRWVFEGFLPRKGAGRPERLAEIAAETRTSVLYEAPHRVERTLTDLVTHCGPDRRVVLAREATKLHEEWFRGTLAEAVGFVADGVKGEFVIVLDGAVPPPPADDGVIRHALAEQFALGATTRDAVASVVDALGVGKRRVYDLALELTAD